MAIYLRSVQGELHTLLKIRAAQEKVTIESLCVRFLWWGLDCQSVGGVKTGDSHPDQTVLGKAKRGIYPAEVRDGSSGAGPAVGVGAASDGSGEFGLAQPGGWKGGVGVQATGSGERVVGRVGKGTEFGAIATSIEAVLAERELRGDGSMAEHRTASPEVVSSNPTPRSVVEKALRSVGADSGRLIEAEAAVPKCAACEGSMSQVKGKWACADTSCGKYGVEQKARK